MIVVGHLTGGLAEVARLANQGDNLGLHTVRIRVISPVREAAVIDHAAIIAGGLHDCV